MSKDFEKLKTKFLLIFVKPALSILFASPLIPIFLKLALQNLIKGPPKAIEASPEVQAALNKWGVHRRVKAGDIEFHYVEKSPSPKAPLMLFVHGYPEFWYTWRYQLEYFSAKYHCVALDLRGYGQTDKPVGKKNYRLELLVEDIKAFITALGYNKIDVLVAHDWGGFICWSFAHMHPDLVSKLVILNSPHPNAFFPTLTSSVSQVLRSWYMFFYQLPSMPEVILSRDNWAAIAVSFTGKKMGVKNRKYLSDVDVDCFRYSFSQPNVATSAINYYRNIFDQKSKELREAFQKKCEVPTVMIWGEQDGALGLDLAHKSGSFANNFTLHTIPGASHWVQQDAPPEVNRLMDEWLEKRPSAKL